jgi:hypothetical protein
MMSENKPCCAAAAVAQLRYLIVGGHRIAITHLDGILEMAKAARSAGERAIRKELLRLVKLHNYVPAPAEKAYMDALFAEYLARKGTGPESGGKEREGKGR